MVNVVENSNDTVDPVRMNQLASLRKQVDLGMTMFNLFCFQWSKDFCVGRFEFNSQVWKSFFNFFPICLALSRFKYL